MTGIFYTGEVSICFAEVSVMEHSLQNFQIPRNPGETGYAQTVCTSSSGNEASAMNRVFEAYCTH